MEKRGFSNSMYVAELRYIQSVHETSEFQNPDRLVGLFLPLVRRWRCKWLGQRSISTLRTDPFYYYLVARTRYYDQVFIDAVSENMGYIINIGSGNDTRSHRFEPALKQKGIKVLECDQAEAVSMKKRKAKKLGTNSHVSYCTVDINDGVWPNLEQWLNMHKPLKGMVFMEGVSPYVNVETFTQFLKFLAGQLRSGSRVAYDSKLRGMSDNFGSVGRTQRPFRLSKDRQDVADYHEEMGLRLHHMERSSELSTRLLTGLAKSGVPLFIEDALIELEVP